MFGLLKVAVIAQQIYHRYARGLTRDERFAALAEGVRLLGRTATQALSRRRIDRPVGLTAWRGAAGGGLARYLRPVLRPGLGHRLPPELTARRIGSIVGALLGRRARHPGSETLLRRVEAKPIHAGNQVELFRSGGHAFTAMYEAVAGAHSEVLLES